MRKKRDWEKELITKRGWEVCCLVIEAVTRVVPQSQGLIQLPGSGRWVRPAHQKDPEVSQTQTMYVLFDRTTGDYIDLRSNRAKKRHDLPEPFLDWGETAKYRNRLCRGRSSCDCASDKEASL